ncbi:hypothetical protein WJX81_001316 [Elliptochloris bilobata]|uniref:Exportin-1/Importin-beta-like domain-containing protein n=1 Tax=Elliptochloris bilobata TaxID=381761 RepID=A0AAW1RMJ1_9CHLO
MYSMDRSPADRALAGQWLQAFQQSSSAWQVCCELVASDSTPALEKLVGAQILRHKSVCRSAAGPATVLTQLLAVLASLAMQWAAWSGALTELWRHLPPDTMLRFLTVLAEEAVDAPLAEAAQDAATGSMRVREWSGDVLRWLARGLPGAAVTERADALRCFGAWARLGVLHEPDTPVEECRALVADTFDALLGSDADLAAAAAVAADLLIVHAPDGLQEELLPWIAPLPRAVLQAASEGDPERAEALCVTFAAFCSANAWLLASPSPEGSALLEGLLQCAALPEGAGGLPASGEPVAAAALAVWAVLGETLGALEPDRRMAPEAARATFSRFLRALLAALSPADRGSEPAGAPDRGGTGTAALGKHGDSFWQDDGAPLAAHAEDPLRETARVLGASAYAGIVAEAASAPGTSPAAVCGQLQASLLALRAAEEQLGEALSPEDPEAGGPEASSAAAAVAGALELIFSAAVATAAEAAGAAPAGALVGRLLDVLQQLAVPLIHHALAAGRGAQALLAFVLRTAGGALREPKQARVAAACILRVCEGAVTAGLAVPQDAIAALLQGLAPPTGLEPHVEQDLVVAAAACTCASAAAHLQSDVIRGLLRPLLPALAGLQAAADSCCGSAGGAGEALALAKATRMVGRLRALLQQAGTFLGQRGPAASQRTGLAGGAPTAPRAVAAFVAAWPCVAQLVVRPLPGAAAAAAALRGQAARCCTLAMRADEQAAMAALPAMAGAAAAAFALPGGHAFVAPLAAALDLLGNVGDPNPGKGFSTSRGAGNGSSSMATQTETLEGRDGATVRGLPYPRSGPLSEGGPWTAAEAALRHALDVVARAPAVVALATPGGGDAAPDLAQAAAVLTTAAARAAASRAWAPPAPRLALAGFSICAACAAACHPDVAAAALACLEALLGTCIAQRPVQQQLVDAAAASSHMVAGGVLRALLGPSPAPRAQRAASVMCGLAALPLAPPPPPPPPPPCAGLARRSVSVLPADTARGAVCIVRAFAEHW